MDIDEVCFERSETEDYNLEDLVIPPDPITKHLIEYRVKVLLKGDIIICTYKQKVPWRCTLSE